MTMTMTDIPETEPEARRLRRELIDDDLLDQLVKSTSDRGIELTGEGGFLPELIKAVLERGMKAELTEHLGYDKHEAAGRGSGNSRNGTSPKTLKTEVGPVKIDQPRDRAGTFASHLVPPGQRRLGGLGRHDHLTLCRGYDDPGDPASPPGHVWYRDLCRDDLKYH